jgi:hypothetical protein
MLIHCGRSVPQYTTHLFGDILLESRDRRNKIKDIRWAAGGQTPVHPQVLFFSLF